MKVNINKLQSGGGFATFTPIIRSLPGTSTTGTQSTSNKKEETSSIIDEKMLEHLYKQGGLVNDVNKLVAELIQLEKTSDMPYLNQNNRSSTLRIAAKINELGENKKYWTDAISRAKENGGLGEVAVDSGKVFIKTKDNKIQSISLLEYSKKRDKVSPLSVQELMYERQYNSSLTGQNGVFTVADNSIGMNKITEHIKSLVAALGTETDKDSRYYSKEQAGEVLKGFGGKQPTKEQANALVALNNVLQSGSDYSKVSLETSSQKNQIKQALNYIWTTLGTPAQEKLAATAVINGISDPKQFIYTVLNSDTDISTSREVTPVKDEDATGKTKSPKEVTDKELTPFEILHNGKTGSRPVAWNDPSTGKKIMLSATGAAPVPMDIKGKPIGVTTLQNILKTENAYVVETGKAYFGDKKIGLNDFGNIVYNGEDSMRVYIPTNSDGSPNYNLLKDFNKLQEHIEANKDSLTPQQINEYYAERGFDYVQVDNNYQIIVNKDIKPFWIMYGYTAEGANVTNNNAQIKALTGEEESNVRQTLKDTWKNEKVTAPTGWFDFTTTYYKGMIAIPYRDDSSIYTGSISGNILAPQTSIDQANVKSKIHSSNIVSGSSDFFNK